MKRALIQFAIEAGAILAIGFVALSIGCTTPVEPQVDADVVWVPSLHTDGSPIVDTIAWDGFYVEPEHELYKHPVTQVRGTWVPRDSRMARCRPQDEPIRDTLRDTTQR